MRGTANKLLVPTYPKQNEGEADQDYTDRVQKDYYDISPIAGIFKSFGDAPNGFKEEMQEIQWSVGLEYIYNDRFSLRAHSLPSGVLSRDSEEPPEVPPDSHCQ